MKGKRILALILALLLAFSLTSCKKEGGEEETAQPEATLAPATTAQPGIQISGEGGPVSFVNLVSDSFGITLRYPGSWANNPGLHTICYYDPNDTSGYRTRFALTVKTLRHTPDKEDVVEQLKDYLEIISGDFEKKSFEVGDLDETATFMGQQKAFCTTYLAFYGKVEIKGYVIATVIERDMYVFHFTTSYKQYEGLEPIMATVRDSIALITPEATGK